MTVARHAVRLLAFVLLLAPAAGAEVTVRATVDPAQVRVGESAAFAVEVDGAQNAPVPEIPPIDGLTVRYVGPETQVSIVNGHVTQSVTYRFSVVAARPGAFTIGPVGVAVSGARYEGAAVTLNAVAVGAPRAGPAAAAGGDQLRLVLSPAKTEAYLHERVPVSLKLYVGNVRVTDLQYPTISGDGVAIEKLPEQPLQQRERTAQGVFQVVDFETTLTPLRSGMLTVGPASMHLGVLVQTRRVQGLRELAEQAVHSKAGSAPALAAAIDFVLEGLCAQKKISRSDERGYASADTTPRRPTRREEQQLEEELQIPRGKKKYYN